MVHFEIYAKDVEAAKSFYSGLFGWSFSAMPVTEEAEYFFIEGEQVGMGKGVTGGLMTRPDDTPEKGSPIRGATLTF